ncbi:COX15/CtaA family protein [Seongchinamella sediminis]|uniref:COX15/CtaA family protein n=1 Tax=Seongchinamella sediminis TaxID=2283635 RepID=UPI0013C33064|nr:COX15/CtaA family protein [Seongchinamella sediminis]
MQASSQPEESAIYRSLISLSIVLTLLTVVLSAYIRLAEVGIGCEPWPDCYARLDPAAEQRGITVLSEQGREMAHYGARVAHRYIASVLGLFILGIFISALRQGHKRSASVWVPLGIFAITVFLSLLGYYTPTRSNPLITMGNLLGGMVLLALLWWLLQREVEARTGAGVPARLRLPVTAALVLVLVQITLGGWSSANYASGNCPGLVSCQGDLLAAGNVGDAFNPQRTITLDATGKVVAEDALGLMSMAHRLTALLTAAYLAWLVRRLRPQPQLRATLVFLSVCSIGQILLGLATVLSGIPLWLLTLHNALAAGLLLACVNLLHRATPAAAAPPPR